VLKLHKCCTFTGVSSASCSDCSEGGRLSNIISACESHGTTLLYRDDDIYIAIVRAWQLHDDEAHQGAGPELVCIQQAGSAQRCKTTEHYRGLGCWYVQVVNLLPEYRQLACADVPTRAVVNVGATES